MMLDTNDTLRLDSPGTPVYLENRITSLAISTDEPADIWLPIDSVLGTVLPDVMCANLIENNDSVRQTKLME